MRNKIFGGIGVVWGGGILVRWLMSGRNFENEAYQAGQNSAALFGVLLLLAGIYYLFKKPSA
jgi:hypothetical protein